MKSYFYKLYEEIMILRKHILIFFTVFLSQVSLAKQDMVDLYFTMNNGLLKYSEISESTLTDVTIDFNLGDINIVSQNNDGSFEENNLTFDSSSFKIPKDIRMSEFDLSNSSSEAIFETNVIQFQASTKALMKKANISAKIISNCGANAGRILDLANRMISDGQATGNTALVTYGRILRDIAIAMFQQCLKQ